MSDFASLNNQFLIAMPGLADPNFSRTVTLICEHTQEGAMGLVINRALDLKLHEVLDQIGIDQASDLSDLPIYLGGPVQNNRGFVLHAPLGNWESTLQVTDTVGVSTSKDILQAIASNQGPEHCLIALGYAGWGAGQLEFEISENSWLNGPADENILFNIPVDQRWAAAAQTMGVDLLNLSSESGHA